MVRSFLTWLIAGLVLLAAGGPYRQPVAPGSATGDRLVAPRPVRDEDPAPQTIPVESIARAPEAALQGAPASNPLPSSARV